MLRGALAGCGCLGLLGVAGIMVVEVWGYLVVSELLRTHARSWVGTGYLEAALPGEISSKNRGGDFRELLHGRGFSGFMGGSASGRRRSRRDRRGLTTDLAACGGRRPWLRTRP